MRNYWSKLWPLLKETASQWNAHNCLRLGASLSYYTLFSIFPLILVVLALLRLLLTTSEPAREAILAALTSVTGGFRDEFIATLEAALQTRRASGIIGTLSLILGASWVLGELVSAFNIIWDVETPGSGGLLAWVRLTFFSLALILAVAFLLLVSMIMSAIITALTQFATTLTGAALLGTAIHWLLNLTILMGVFALLFKYLPRTRVAWRDVWLGAALTAIAWSVLQYAIATYIAWSGYKDYGPVGAILALVAWVYLSSQVVFLGGEFTAVYARHYGSGAGAPKATTVGR
jgi:membrane protein